jgi:hypothetical protein
MFPGLHETVHQPHTRPPDNPRGGGGGDVRHPHLRVPVLVRAVREDQARDRLTSAQAAGREQPQSVRQVRVGRRLEQVPGPPRQATRHQASQAQARAGALPGAPARQAAHIHH